MRVERLLCEESFESLVLTLRKKSRRLCRAAEKTWSDTTFVLMNDCDDFTLCWHNITGLSASSLSWCRQLFYESDDTRLLSVKFPYGAIFCLYEKNQVSQDDLTYFYRIICLSWSGSYAFFPCVSPKWKHHSLVLVMCTYPPDLKKQTNQKTKTAKCSLIANNANVLPIWLVTYTIQHKSIENVFCTHS